MTPEHARTKRTRHRGSLTAPALAVSTYLAHLEREYDSLPSFSGELRTIRAWLDRAWRAPDPGAAVIAMDQAQQRMHRYSRAITSEVVRHRTSSTAVNPVI